MKRRFTFIALALLVLVIASSVSVFAQGDVVTLRYTFGANREEAAVREQLIAEFERLYPNIKIEAEIPPGTAQDAILTMFAGGNPPDVTMAWELNYPAYATQNMYLDLDPLMANDEEFQAYKDDYYQTYLDMFNWDGKQVAMPEQNTGIVLFYNKGLFREAGLEFPPDNFDDMTWTWDVFLEYAKALTKVDENGRVTQFGYADMWDPPLTAMVWSFTNGAEWFDRGVNPTRSTINTPESVEAVQFYADLINVHRVAPSNVQSQVQTNHDMFADGKIGMGTVGHWFVPLFNSAKEEKGLDYDVAPFPIGPNGHEANIRSEVGGTGLAIAAATKHPEEAWEFVKFMTGPRGQEVIASTGLFTPVMKSVSENVFAKSEFEPDNAIVFTDTAAHAKPMPLSPEWGRINEAWVRLFDDVFRGIKPASEVLPLIEAENNAALRRVR